MEGFVRETLATCMFAFAINGVGWNKKLSQKDLFQASLFRGVTCSNGSISAAVFMHVCVGWALFLDPKLVKSQSHGWGRGGVV